MKIRTKWLSAVLAIAALGLFVATAIGHDSQTTRQRRPKHGASERLDAVGRGATTADAVQQDDLQPPTSPLLPTPLDEPTLPDDLHEPRAEHVAQEDLMALVGEGKNEEAFEEAFEGGDELFETTFNALDGVGAFVGSGSRFSQLPRADLIGPGEWANHMPKRITGPNAEACNDCHGEPFDDGAGRAANNNVRDPLHTGDLASFIQRNTPHLFGAGAVQVLAEEMTEELFALRDQAVADACDAGRAVTVSLNAKGVHFGELLVVPTATQPCTPEFDRSAVVGVNPDLVVRPFQWKGVNATLREFNRDAAHQELGMQSVETTGDGVDGDYDGVVNELTIGDQTAMAIYVAGQPRPTTSLELAALGLIDPLTIEEEAAIEQGQGLFDLIGCADCHVPQLTLTDPVFYEPSQNPNYRDARFPAGQDPVARGLDPAKPIQFDLTADQPDNIIILEDDSTETAYRLGSLAVDNEGRALVALFGDLKRHDMGLDLAESIDDEGIASSVFITENLWGVGSTGPYLHDGRATTLTEAILAHGGEAEPSRDAFMLLNRSEQAALVAFLDNLVLYKMP